MTGEERGPTVTVIVATYNRSAMLRLALQSLLHQDFQDFTAWIVGDACTDDSESVVRSFGDNRLQWLNLEINSGNQSRSNNEGLRRAKSRFVAYLNHDDLWFPSHLSLLLKSIRETGADWVHSMYTALGPNGPRSCIGAPPAGASYLDHRVTASCVMHTRDLFETCGPWISPHDLTWEAHDSVVELSRRVLKAGKVIRFCPRLTVLKFGSDWFGAYSMVGEPPQLKYLQAMQEAPDALERNILAEVATRLTYHHWRREPIREHLWRAFWIARSRLLDMYGRHRWPLSVFLQRRYRERIGRLRVMRGLRAELGPRSSSTLPD